MRRVEKNELMYSIMKRSVDCLLRSISGERERKRGGERERERGGERERERGGERERERECVWRERKEKEK